VHKQLDERRDLQRRDDPDLPLHEVHPRFQLVDPAVDRADALSDHMLATSAGPEARVAVKTAESIGERAGDAYADATPQEARERSRNAVRRGATRAGAQAGGGGLFRQFDQQTFSVFAAFALGYAAALFIHRRSQ